MVDSIPYYCISQGRCRLCQFKLEDGEVVLAAVNDQVVSSEFPFFRNTTFYDDDILDAKFHMCCRLDCGFKGHQRSCFHGECYNFRLYTVSPKFLATTEYSFRPSILEERRRTDRMLRILTKRLSLSWAKGLPEEICWMIAGYLIRECAIITAQELANGDSASDSIIDLSHNVYARYIMIEGIRYIRGLRNSTGSTPKLGETLLLESRSSIDIQNVCIGEDHLGIRQIHLSSPSKSRLRIRGVWWRQLSESCISKIRIRTDGLKVRDLVGNQSVTAPARIYWPIQAPPTVTIIDLVNLQTPLAEPNGLRMSFFQCNDAHTTGYSMATNGTSIATIHTHGQKLDLTIYEEVDAFFRWSMVWIYMPMDQDEYVTEICRRFGFRHVRPDSLGLMFTTNKKRTTLFGSYRPPPSLNADYQFDRIYTPPRSSSRIYFNEWDSISTGNEIKFLGFEKQAEKPVSQPYPKSLVPISLEFQTTYNEPWFYSFCSMEDVMKITLCIDKTAGHKPIIGMLLTYGSKHRACVGQYRLDWVIKPIEVDQARKLHIGIKRTTKGLPYVADISMHAPTDCSSTSWLDVSWNGRLEWSFSHRQCKLYYHSNQERS